MQTPSQEEVRRAVAAARTVVVKVGSSSLTQPSGHLDVDKLNALVGAIAQVRMLGGNIVLVSSGAIAAGFGPLGFESRPTDVATQQATASVGQGLLMAQYEMAFGRYGIRVGQLLITAEDTMQPRQYRNARRTMAKLLELGVVPIVNENDALASNEIRFGDNDRLSALIANMVRADALILLTDVDALYTAPPSEPGSHRIGFVPNITELLDRCVWAVQSRAWAPAVWSRSSRPRAWPPSPAFRPCSPPPATPVRHSWAMRWARHSLR